MAAFRDLLHTLDNTVAATARPAPCILAHLNWLLNSQRDRTPHLAGFGMPDLHDYLTKPDPETAVAVELRRVIERYEPRLAKVRVLPDKGPEGSFFGRFQARFVIEAVLAVESEHVEFREMAEIDHQGGVDLR